MEKSFNFTDVNPTFIHSSTSELEETFLAL